MSDSCPYCEKRYTDYKTFQGEMKSEKPVEVAVCTRCKHIRVRNAETLESE